MATPYHRRFRPARPRTILPPPTSVEACDFDDCADEAREAHDTEPAPPPVMVALAPIDVLQALPANGRDGFVSLEGDGFVRLEVVTSSTSDARRRKLDRAMSALIDAGFEVWPGEDGASLEVSRPAPAEHITVAVFDETEPGPGELVEDLRVLASEAAARGFTLVAAEIRSLSREVAGGATADAARAALKEVAEAATAARQPTWAELYGRADEACERAMRRGGR